MVCFVTNKSRLSREREVFFFQNKSSPITSLPSDLLFLFFFLIPSLFCLIKKELPLKSPFYGFTTKNVIKWETYLLLNETLRIENADFQRRALTTYVGWGACRDYRARRSVYVHTYICSRHLPSGVPTWAPNFIFLGYGGRG